MFKAWLALKQASTPLQEEVKESEQVQKQQGQEQSLHEEKQVANEQEEALQAVLEVLFIIFSSSDQFISSISNHFTLNSTYLHFYYSTGSHS